MQRPKYLPPASAPALLAMLAISAGCHQRAAPVANDASVAAAQQQAQHEVEQAQIEARKDIKSETKIMGADSKDVARARVTGVFDVAMARADGDRSVAIQQCLTLQPSAQQSCKHNADADYQTAVAKAKANRAAQQP